MVAADPNYISSLRTKDKDMFLVEGYGLKPPLSHVYNASKNIIEIQRKNQNTTLVKSYPDHRFEYTTSLYMQFYLEQLHIHYKTPTMSLTLNIDYSSNKPRY